MSDPRPEREAKRAPGAPPSLGVWVCVHLVGLPLMWVGVVAFALIVDNGEDALDLRRFLLPMIVTTATAFWWGVHRIVARWGEGITTKLKALFAGYLAWSVGLPFFAASNLIGFGLDGVPLTWERLGDLLGEQGMGPIARFGVTLALANGVVALWLATMVEVWRGGRLATRRDDEVMDRA